MVLSLFAAAMALLVIGGNAVLTFVGWEVAGLCSYLLIAFFQDRTGCRRQRDPRLRHQPGRRCRAFC
jgi:NADH:ubiquinone oxidoreductase subunit 5 (subunit L)/multisubunit Na+/H+ antiporter MnhA subunit